MTRKELVAEILSDLRQYDDAGLIDYRSVNRWIRNELKRFGKNITILTEKFLEVENGNIDLPDNFFSLDMICKVDKHSYHLNTNCNKIIEQSHYWKQRLESTYVWDNQSQSHIKQDFKCIEERVVRDGCDVSFRYVNPTLLKLVKGYKKDNLSAECKNFKVYNSPYEVSINDNKAYFNFNKSTVWLYYNALPTTDDGDLLIPEIRNLEEYLIAYCRRKILESLFYNDEDTNLINKIQLAKQEERELYGMAQTAVKFERLSPDFWKKIKNKNKIETNHFERMFPKQ